MPFLPPEGGSHNRPGRVSMRAPKDEVKTESAQWVAWVA